MVSGECCWVVSCLKGPNDFKVRVVKIAWLWYIVLFVFFGGIFFVVEWPSSARPSWRTSHNLRWQLGSPPHMSSFIQDRPFWALFSGKQQRYNEEVVLTEFFWEDAFVDWTCWSYSPSVAIYLFFSNPLQVHRGETAQSPIIRPFDKHPNAPRASSSPSTIAVPDLQMVQRSIWFVCIRSLALGSV